MQPTLNISCAKPDASIPCDIKLVSAAGLLAGRCDFALPLEREDREELRWLLEDRPRLRTPAAQQIADRIQERFGFIGSELGKAIFGMGPEGAALAAAVCEHGQALAVRIVEDSSAPWLPWELITVPGAETPLACTADSFVRSRTGSARPQVPAKSQTPGELRILLVVSRPSGEQDVPFRSVASRVIAAVRSQPDCPIRVDLLRPPTCAALQKKLEQAAAESSPYQVVHFDGHGIYEASPFNPRLKRGYLRFEGEGGEGDNVDGRTLGNLLRENGVRLLLLNACRSAFVEKDDSSISSTPFESLAADVHATGIEGVLAMGFDVYAVTAAAIIADVYAALSAGRSAGQAVTIARQRLRARSAGLEWMIPVVYEWEATALLGRREDVPALSIPISSTTPATELFIDPDGADGARSALRPFVGYDDVLLNLERGLRENGAVELIGLTGAGKSATAAEFARWMAFTYTSDQAAPSAGPLSAIAARMGNRAAVLVVDAAKCAGLSGLLSAAAKRLEALGGAPISAASDGEVEDLLSKASASLPLLWLLENADTQAHGPARSELARLVTALGAGNSKVVLTGRVSCELAGVPRVVAAGLDDQSVNDLLRTREFEYQGDPAILEAWLDWTQGLPELVLQVVRFLLSTPPGSLKETRALLQKIELGNDPPPGFGAASGIASLVFRQDFADERAPFALYLFHGFLSDELWENFSMLLGARSQNHLGGARYEFPELLQVLAPAARHGLVCAPAPGWLLFHPMAPFASSDPFFGICNGLGGPGASEHHRNWIRSMVLSCGSQSALLPRFVRRKGVPEWLEARAMRRCLLFSTFVAVDTRWWSFAPRLLRTLRDALLAVGREAEWEQILMEALEQFQKYPPTAQDAALDDPNRIMLRLLADHARSTNDPDRAASLEAAADRVAEAERGKVLVKDDRDQTPVMDVGAIQRIATLIRQAETLRRQNSPEALSPLQEALDLANATKDISRVGEIQLGMALVYGNVTAVRDLAKYEEFAKKAIEGPKVPGPKGDNLMARAKNSVGNAILQQLGETDGHSAAEKRIQEAEAALLFAKESAASDGYTKASATNALGRLRDIAGDASGAADEYLQAAQAFGSLEEWDAGATAYLNAAQVLSRASRRADASAAARDGLEMLSHAAQKNAALAGALSQIAAEGAKAP